MPIDVTMPDGTVIQGVPDNITQSELSARYAKMQTGAKPASTGMDMLKAVPAGLAQTASGTLNTLTHPGIIAKMLLSPFLGSDVGNSASAVTDVAAQGAMPTASIAAKRSSDVASYEPQTIPGQYVKTAASFTPAAFGGVGGDTLLSQILSRAARVAVPAASSETAGQLTKGTAAEPWARTIFGLIGGLGEGAVEGALASRGVPPEARGTQYVQHLMDQSKVSPDDLAAGAGGKPLTSAEVIGPNAQTNLMALGRREGQTADALQAQMAQRASGRTERLFDDMTQASGIDPSAARGQMDDVLKAGRKAAAPLYKEAFSGGSTAPLTSQLEDQLNAASKAHASAVQATSDAENELTMANASHLPTDNVYGASSRNNALTDAQQKLAAAQQAAQQASSARQAIADKLRQAQSDASPGVNGGVWSPRIQQFLESPDVKAGLSRGLKIQAREALAKGEQFNPTEYAIKGFDESGSPIVGNVPNLRLLDAGKRGMDAMLEDFRDPVTKQMTWNEDSKSLDSVRSAYIDAIDQVAPDSYKQARSVASDYLSANSAFNTGQKAILNPNVTEKQFADVVAKMSDTDRQALKGGIANQIFDMAQNGRLKPAQFLTPRAQTKIAIAMGSDKASTFLDNLQSEAAMRAFEQRAVPAAGSPTMPLSQAVKEQDSFGGMPVKGEDVVSFARHPVAASTAMALKMGGKAIDNLRTSGLTTAGRDEAGRLLMMNPDALAATLRNMPKPGPQPYSGMLNRGLINALLANSKNHPTP